MLKNILIFVSLIVLVVAKHKKVIDETTGELDSIKSEDYSQLEGTTGTDESESSSTSTLDDALTELLPKFKTYIKNLNCQNTKMGPFKCSMVQKYSKKYEKNPNPAKMKSTVIRFMSDLQAKNQVDPELAELIELCQSKYGKLIVA